MFLYLCCKCTSKWFSKLIFLNSRQTFDPETPRLAHESLPFKSDLISLKIPQLGALHHPFPIIIRGVERLTLCLCARRGSVGERWRCPGTDRDKEIGEKSGTQRFYLSDEKLVCAVCDPAHTLSPTHTHTP